MKIKAVRLLLVGSLRKTSASENAHRTHFSDETSYEYG